MNNFYFWRNKKSTGTPFRIMVLLVLLTLFFSSVSINAAIYYVDNIKGNDENNGTKDTPFLSLKVAIDKLQAGDTLYIIDNGSSAPYRDTIEIKRSGGDDRVITVAGIDSIKRPTIVGSENWSGDSLNKDIDWLVGGNDTYILPNVNEPVSLWWSSLPVWRDRGVDGLVLIEKAASYKEMKAGQWMYLRNKRTLIYKKLNADQLLKDMHIESVINRVLLNLNNAGYVTYKNLRFMFSAKTAIHIKFGSNITLDSIEVYHSKQNAISIKGGDAIKIENCRIDDAKNNGIVLGGSKNDKLKNTLIKNCIISNVTNNDCITIHKDKNYDDVGSVHHIESNILSGCAEQGIDITSGSDITLLRNTTYGNGDSGILIGHWASNILIKNHLSVDDGRYAGILVHKSNAVSLIDNCILNSDKHQLVFKDAKNIFFKGNIVYQGKSSRGSVIDIAKNTKGIRFIDNRIVSESISGSLLLRYLNNNDPVKSMATFTSNIWSATHGGKSRRFYTVDYDRHEFSKHNQYYGRNSRDMFGDSLNFEVLSLLIVKNSCDLGLVPYKHMK